MKKIVKSINSRGISRSAHTSGKVMNNTKNLASAPKKKPEKRDNPVLGTPVDDGEEIMIKFD